MGVGRSAVKRLKCVVRVGRRAARRVLDGVLVGWFEERAGVGEVLTGLEGFWTVFRPSCLMSRCENDS